MYALVRFTIFTACLSFSNLAFAGDRHPSAVPVVLASQDAGTASLDAGTAAAAPVLASPETDLAGYAKSIYEAVQHSNYRMLAALLLMGIVWALRKWWPAAWMKTDRGGASLALMVGVFGAATTALVAGKSVGASIADGIVVGITGAGGFSVLKKIISPADVPAAPAPAAPEAPK